MKYPSLVVVLLTAFACGGEPPPTEPAATETPAALTSVVSVLSVRDHAAATAWYRSWIGREADVVPVEGVAEWQLTAGGWIQVALDPERAGGSTVVVGVLDVVAQRQVCVDAGITVGDVLDYGVVKLVEVADPDGNKVVFVQEIEG